MLLRNSCYRENENQLFLYFSILIFFWAFLLLFAGMQPAEQQDLRPVLADLIPEEFFLERIPHFTINYQGIVRSTENPLELIHFLVRKAAHFIFYGILSLLVVCQQQYFRVNSARSFLISIIFVGLVAITDEYTQHFIPGRTGMAMDVFLDLAGSSIALIWLGIKGKTERTIIDWAKK